MPRKRSTGRLFVALQGALLYVLEIEFAADVCMKWN